MAANIIQTRQKEYVNSMSALLSVFAGGLLRKFAVKQEALVGEEIYFYKSSGGSSTRNTRNMFAPSYTGQGGKIEAIKVEPDYILWDEKIPQKELWKTKLDVKSEISIACCEKVITAGKCIICGKIVYKLWNGMPKESH